MAIYAPPCGYEEARSRIRDLDVIAWEGRGAVSRAISLVTLGTVTHVGISLWWGDSLMVLESREFRGGRAVRLREQVPGNGVLVYRAREPLPESGAAIQCAIEGTGAGYSYVGCLRFLRRLGLPLRLPAEDRGTRGARFCSEFVSLVYRMGGIDLRPDLLDAETAPADLVSSPHLTLQFRAMLPGSKGATD